LKFLVSSICIFNALLNIILHIIDLHMDS
jgi:hypothetical protein